MARLHLLVSIARPDQWIGGHDIHYAGEMQCRWWCMSRSMVLSLGHTERESFGVITHWIAVRALLLLFFFWSLGLIPNDAIHGGIKER